MSTVQPEDYARRSPVYRLLRAAGATFSELNNAAIVSCVDFNRDLDVASTMGIADLSPLPRVGFKGRATPDWLADAGVKIPDAPNLARLQDDGTLVARLSNDEHVLLSDLSCESRKVAELSSAWELEAGRLCYMMPRADTHAWFAITGECAPAMLSKICGVDARPHKFANGAIAQTSIARINGVLFRHDQGSTIGYYVLADTASADFLWPCLLDAMQEFDGAPVGIDALWTLSSG